MEIRMLVTTVMIAAAAGTFVAGQGQQSGQPAPQPAQSAPAMAKGQAAALADTGVGRYYTEAQALRGQTLYNRHCLYCHRRTAGARGLVYLPEDATARYPSVYYLYRRMEYMPANDVTSITPQQRADILAYMLQSHGLLPGETELKADYSSMMGMPLPVEPGFVHVFNGRDLSGWQFLLGLRCTPQPEGCGRTDPEDIFYVKDGMLVTTGRVHGAAFLPKKYKNFTLRLEQRVPAQWDDADDLIQDQTGLLIFQNSKGGEMRLWGDNFIEVEGKYYDLLSMYPYPNGGIKMKTMVDKVARRLARNPVNQWQRFEIVSKDGVIKNYLNGTLVATAELGEDLAPGYIALQSQGGPVEWRNIRLREE